MAAFDREGAVVGKAPADTQRARPAGSNPRGDNFYAESSCGVSNLDPCRWGTAELSTFDLRCPAVTRRSTNAETLMVNLIRQGQAVFQPATLTARRQAALLCLCKECALSVDRTEPREMTGWRSAIKLVD